MTKQESFSELLDQRVAKNTITVNSSDIEEFLQEVEIAKKWVLELFDDESAQPLGYIGNPIFLQGTNKSTLDIYIKVADLIFCVNFQRSSGYILRVGFQIGYLQKVTNKNERTSCFRKIDTIYKENESYKTSLRIKLEGKDGEWPKLWTDRALISILRNSLLGATTNIVLRKPDLRSTETIDQLQKELLEKKNFVAFCTDHDTSQDVALDVHRYIARVPDDILNMSLEMLVETPYTERDVQARNECLAELQSHGVITVRDVLPLTYQELSNRCHNQWWGTDGIVEALSVLKLELVPPNNAPYLPIGTPSTVIGLLEYSGFKSYERARNCLARAQVTTTQQLLQKDRNDLLAITNFGQQSLEIVETALLKCGLRLKPPSY